MLRILIIISLVASAFSLSAQATFNFQAVARDANHNSITNEILDFTINVLRNGEVIYTEEFPGQDTGPLGILNLPIGLGDNPSSSFDNLDWASGALAVRILVDNQAIGTTPLGFGPPSIYAKNSGRWRVTSDTSSSHFGNAGINVDFPLYPLHIAGDIIQLDGEEDCDINLNLPAAATSNAEIRYQVDGEQHAFLRYLKNVRTLLINVEGEDQAARLSLRNGRVGVGTTNPLSFFHLHAPGADNALRISAPGFSEQVRLHLARRGNGTEYGYLHLGGETKLRGNGETSVFQGRLECGELKINGADIIEKFCAKEEFLPGEVVLLDPNNPKGVIKADQPYSFLAIGVISGAGGVKHGMELVQDGVLDGDAPVAVIGRVWVRVTGPVSPGQMLTTSAVPGRAMAVLDPLKGFGATIGKALSDVNEEGMVLMLVSIN